MRKPTKLESQKTMGMGQCTDAGGGGKRIKNQEEKIKLLLNQNLKMRTDV